jgi:DNA polymerase I-like protein with 3'-5' exonuclease and polymerase domains/uracil-DNA glycosylase
MIVGEAPGADEEARGEPFVGASGLELTRMLTEAGISRSECFVTNVCRIRPPRNEIELFLRKPFSKSGKPTKEDAKKLREGIDPKKFVPLRNLIVHPAVKEGFELLKKEILLVKPNIIITVGNTSMFVLTGRWGITKWRGSMLGTDTEIPGKELVQSEFKTQVPWKVIPTYHPAAILRQWDWRAVLVADLRRAARFRDGSAYPTPKWNFIIRPTYEQAISTLDQLLLRVGQGEKLKLSHDIETRAGHIACIGISWSRFDAICIPLMSVGSPEGYWSLDRESAIVERLSRLLTHPNTEVIGQNHTYDSQYTDRHFLFTPRLTCDTMIGQHALFSDMPKALYFIASLYCDYYVYWKDEGKNWDPKVGEDQLWYYNCEDCVYTYEVAEVEERLADELGLREVFDFQQKMFWPVLQAMTRGVRIDLARRSELIMEVQTEIERRRGFLSQVLGFDLNPDSPKQMHTLFYEDFNLPVQMKRGKKGEPSRPTLEDDALQKLSRIEPLLQPIINAISDIRTLGKFLSNFLCRPLDIDDRMRCSFNIGGSESGKSAPKTYRLSSSENAFGSGTNLQNIPSEKSKSLGKAAARGGIPALGDPYQFPNIREIFIPDPGHTWFDLDLERADLFVVCWEAEDEQLKAAMRLGVDIHLLNAFVITGKEPPPLEELIETHPKYRDHRGPMKLIREFAKVFCHGTNYGGQARTMAAHTGRTVAETERAQRIWFGAHPGILRWHDRVKKQVTSRHFVENKFGYRWYIFDRVDSILPEAIAWGPQSTVSIVINRIWDNLYRNLPSVQVLLQVHDSLCGQIPRDLTNSLLPLVRGQASISIPYPDPLVIPVSIKTSEKSWGHC